MGGSSPTIWYSERHAQSNNGTSSGRLSLSTSCSGRLATYHQSPWWRDHAGDLRKEWEMFFYRASRSSKREQKKDVKENVARIGILFVSIENALIPYSSPSQRGVPIILIMKPLSPAWIGFANMHHQHDNLCWFWAGNQQLHGKYSVKKTESILYHKKAKQLLAVSRS